MPPPGANIIDTYRQNDGYGTLENPEKFLNQDYEALKSYCLDQGLTYVDEMFPPDVTSIGEETLSPEDLDRVVWKRAGELVSNPSFIEDGVSRFDFSQGAIANCWLLAPLGALTLQRDFLHQVVDVEQSYDEDYCGLFHFRFWRFGNWVDVVIDDLLPTIDEELIFVRSENQNEFWPPLLEKAYAKVCGSYDDLNCGFANEALMDFSGCVHIHVRLSEPPADLWELMSRASQSKSMMVCAIRPNYGEIPEEPVLPNGLVVDHGYTVTGFRQVKNEDVAVDLVRLWNPWCQGEWTGDWSDESPLWDAVSSEDRELCHYIEDDGEFWMTLEDFVKFYTDLDICSKCPDFLDGSPSDHWKTSVYDGRWVAGTTAGGCLDNTESYWMNPQYRVKVGESPSDYSASQGDKNTLVSLMQKPDKRNRRLINSLFIGFSVYEITEEYETWTGKFPASFFTDKEPIAGPDSFINLREVTELMMLEPGEYLIVPCTYSRDETASFILTLVSKVETQVEETSDGLFYEPMEGEEPVKGDDESRTVVTHQLSTEYDDVTAGELQKILNEKIQKGGKKSGGFSTEVCRTMVALLDVSLTGKLSGKEFLFLMKKFDIYKDIFNSMDVNKTGTLSLSEFQEALAATGTRVPDKLRDLLAVRYGLSSGEMTLENFVVLVLRLDCMNQLFSHLSDKIDLTLTLQEKEWLHLSMYP
ncbi:calpain-1 catalytic subunit-like [Halichoeres trimaculatus]|uniref:calpain-1 catalytic subunit-like n=1 Tax=Halichoeres trimaculatus TaxID=147232 RepID=UPI003D9E0E0A